MAGSWEVDEDIVGQVDGKVGKKVVVQVAGKVVRKVVWQVAGGGGGVGR